MSSSTACVAGSGFSFARGSSERRRALGLSTIVQYLAGEGYHSNAIRKQVEERGAMPNIPPKVNRKWKNCFWPYLYRGATRSNACSAASRTSAAWRQATIETPSISSPPSCIAAAISYWL